MSALQRQTKVQEPAAHNAVSLGNELIATFLGHQSWMLSAGASSILLDPILADGFGSADQIEIFPPRKIHVRELPPIQAVVLSHEHSDHFHLPSLALLPRNTPVYVGINMPQFVQELIEDLGLCVHRVRSGESFDIGSLSMKMFAVSQHTVLWESRVNQLLVSSLSYPDETLFIAVDALLSTDFIELLKKSEIASPSVVALSNNAQITPPGVFGSLDNLISIDGDGLKKGQHGLKILASLLNDYLVEIRSVREVIICGGGFMKGYQELGPFPFSDQRQLAEAATRLSAGVTVHGPYPGEAYRFATGGLAKEIASFVVLDEERFERLAKQSSSFIDERRSIPMIPTTRRPLGEDPRDWSATESMLAGMVLPLMLSPLGELMIDLREYLTGALKQTRFVIMCTDECGTPCAQWGLDLVKASFERQKPKPIEELIAGYPFGVALFASDLKAMAGGEVQIWDLAGVSMRAWFLGPAEMSPVAFLYAWLGEHISPHLYRNNYAMRLQDLAKTETNQK